MTMGSSAIGNKFIGYGKSADYMGDGLPAVDLGSGRSAKFIAAGAYHTCAQLDDGGVKCWGENITMGSSGSATPRIAGTLLTRWATT